MDQPPQDPQYISSGIADGNKLRPPTRFEVKLRTLFATKDSDLPEDLREVLSRLKVSFATPPGKYSTLNRTLCNAMALLRNTFPALPKEFYDPINWIYWHREQTQDSETGEDQLWWRQISVADGDALPSHKTWSGTGEIHETILISSRVGPLPSLESAKAVFGSILGPGGLIPGAHPIDIAHKYMKFADLEWEVKGAYPILKYGERTAYLRAPDAPEP